MKNFIKNPTVKIVIGIFFIVIGFLAFVTPLTPGSWLIFVGAELIGIRFLSRKKFSEMFGIVKNRFFNKNKEKVEEKVQNEEPPSLTL